MKNEISKSLVNLIDHINDNYHNSFMKCCKELEINTIINTVGEFLVFGYIGENQPTNNTSITKDLNMTKGGISKVVARFIDRGIIKANKDKSNQKEVYYTLTDKGSEIYKKILEYKEKNAIEANAYIESFSKEDQKTIKAFLDGVINYIK